MDSNDRSLERTLEDIYRVEPPAALRAQLLEIASEKPDPVPNKAQPGAGRRLLAWLGIDRAPGFDWRLTVPAFAVVAAVALVWVAGTRLEPETPLVADRELASELERQQAIRDFVIVMNYLQAATASAHRGVQEEIGGGLRIAFNRGEQSFNELSTEITNGG